MSENQDLIPSDVALHALVRLLKGTGYDLNQLLVQYEASIMGSELSGSAPQYKSKSIEVLKKAIQEA